MTVTNVSQMEAEAALTRLLDHHQKWVMAQPEVLFLWAQDRHARKRVAELLVKELLTIPRRDFNENTPPNRTMRRAMLQALKQSNPEWWKEVNL